MNAANIGITNQKIKFAKIHLAEFQQVLGKRQDEQINSLLASYEQAVCVHLILACHALKQEIAADYNIVIHQYDSFADLLKLLEENDVVCQQCSILAELENTENSWLHCLIIQYDALWSEKYSTRCVKIQTVNRGKNSISVDSITLSDVTNIPIEIKFHECINEIQSILNQYRMLMQEW